MEDKIIKRCEALLNTFENDSGSEKTDYYSIYLYHDGLNKRVQVTLARGFTSDGGNLWKVIQRYIDKGGANSNFFKSYKNKMDGNLWKDKEFLKYLVKSSKEEQIMRDSQDEIFREVYLKPAIDFFNLHQFKLNLSFAVIVDSYLHSGRIREQLTNRFKEKKPDNGGDEKKWIKAYIEARHNWLSSTSGLENTVYRTQFFKDQIKKNNWSFDLPLVANGTKIIV